MQLKKDKTEDKLFRQIYPLAKRIKELQTQFKDLGGFVEDRELLECRCGFMEDVNCEGLLITYKYKKGKKNLVDSGLRFKKNKSNKYICPICKSEHKQGKQR